MNRRDFLATGAAAALALPAARAASPEPAASAWGTAELRKLRGKWVFLTVDSGACDENCRHKLYVMRQVRAPTPPNAWRRSCASPTAWASSGCASS
ncbi:MAG: hypothetical protein RLZZ221_2688 [Verrucomicrobiota bacterium]